IFDEMKLVWKMWRIPRPWPGIQPKLIAIWCAEFTTINFGCLPSPVQSCSARYYSPLQFAVDCNFQLSSRDSAYGASHFQHRPIPYFAQTLSSAHLPELTESPTRRPSSEY